MGPEREPARGGLGGDGLAGRWPFLQPFSSSSLAERLVRSDPFACFLSSTEKLNVDGVRKERREGETS